MFIVYVNSSILSRNNATELEETLVQQTKTIEEYDWKLSELKAESEQYQTQLYYLVSIRRASDDVLDCIINLFNWDVEECTEEWNAYGDATTLYDQMYGVMVN